jgi:opacity protein-like surface antigen
MNTRRKPLFLKISFSDIRGSLCTLIMVVIGSPFATSLAIAQDAAGANSSQPPMRTNSQDIQLATMGSNSGLAQSENGSSQDQWKSLTTTPAPSSDPMVSPSPTPQAVTTTNTPSSLLVESKPSYKKDEYGPQTGWGLRTAVGPALQQSVSARSNGGADYSNFNFSPGFRADFEAFYNVTNGFYFGLESGFIYNSISSVHSSALGDLVAGGEYFGNGAFYQVPALANIRFQIPNTGKFRGYCTGGVGVVWDYLTSSTALGTYSQHQWNYAFQLGAGFQYNLLPGLDLDTCFKTFITPNPLIFSDSTSQVKASYNYTLEIGLAYRF